MLSVLPLINVNHSLREFKIRILATEIHKILLIFKFPSMGYYFTKLTSS